MLVRRIVKIGFRLLLAKRERGRRTIPRLLIGVLILARVGGWVVWVGGWIVLHGVLGVGWAACVRVVSTTCRCRWVCFHFEVFERWLAGEGSLDGIEPVMTSFPLCFRFFFGQALAFGARWLCHGALQSLGGSATLHCSLLVVPPRCTAVSWWFAPECY
jgi:hypothetical protein